MVFVDRLLYADVYNSIATDVNDLPMKIDANNNGAIEVSEAESVYGLNIVTDTAFPWQPYINDVTGLEAFVNLRSLNCNLNNIAWLDVTSMSNLMYLSCSDNPINYINAGGLTQLQGLYAQNCGLTSMSQINLQGNGLLQMELDRNNFDSFSLGNFPDLMTLSLTQCDMTSVNLTNLPSLDVLYIYDNQLTALEVSGLPNLKWLYCYNNSIASIDLSQNLLLEALSITFNELTNLDVSQNHSLYTLDATNNNLVSLNIKNGINEALYLQANPNLAYICVDESQMTDPELFANAISQANSYCSFTPGGTYYTVAGTTTFDNDSNGCDAEDVQVPNVKFSVFDGSSTQTVICNNSGNYNIPFVEGTYTMTPTFENAEYFNFSPPVSSFSFPDVASPFFQNLCITPNGLHADLEIVVVPLNPSRPGFNSYFKIICKNKGNQTQSGIVNFTFDDEVFDLIASNPPVAWQTLNQLTWNFNNLVPFETRHFDVTLQLNSPTDEPPVNGGAVLNLTGQIMIDENDVTPSDNTFALIQTVVNSFDPNDKTCLEGNTLSPENVGKYVHYMIRFENTGTADAQNIVVKDVIDTAKFDITSLVALDGSHDYYTRIKDNKVEFIFENINLPFDDANNDGYVLFKIKTNPTLVIGDTFSNTASIYFDYNFPIVTEPAVTTIAVLKNKDFAFEDYFTIFPNPVNAVLQIQSKKDIAISSISIYNMLGQVVLVIPNAAQIKSVDVSSLKTGNYFIKINSDMGNSNSKFIKK